MEQHLKYFYIGAVCLLLFLSAAMVGLFIGFLQEVNGIRLEMEEAILVEQKDYFFDACRAQAVDNGWETDHCFEVWKGVKTSIN